MLTLWNESDYIASKTDSELVAAIVNRGHPGKATFVAVPGIDHGFNQAEDQEESYLAEGAVSFNPVVIETLTKWIKVQGGS